MSEQPIGLYNTARLQLRDLRAGDESAVFTLLSDLIVVRYMLFPVFTEEQAEQFVAHGRDMRRERSSTNFVLGIALAKGSDELIGLCGLVVNPRYQAGEVWYLLAPTHWGKGLMTEAVSALVRIGFQERGLHRIWATCLPENPASGRILEKLGFRREGLQRENLPIHGIWHDSYLYALLNH